MSQDPNQSGNDPTSSSYSGSGSSPDPTSSPWNSSGAGTGSSGDEGTVSFQKNTGEPGPAPDAGQQAAQPGWDQAQQPYGGDPYGGYGAQPGYGAPQPGYGAPQPGGWDPNAYPPPGSYGAPGYPDPSQPQPYGAYGAYPPAYPVAAPTNTMAILSLIFAFVFAPLGLVFGFVARSQIKTSGESGDGLALAGIIISGVFVALFILFFVFIFALAGAASTYPYR